MRFRSQLLSFALTCFILPSVTLAQITAPAPPEIAAKGYLLIDFDSGRVLASKAANTRLDPASITKLMTAYAVFRAIKSGQISLQDTVLVSEKAWRTPGSRMFIEVGKRVPVEELLPGMIVQSGNDASVALAEYVGGTEATFADIMNQLAAELGMVNTHYSNSTGLPTENHYTSAEDISILAAALIREFPDYYRWYSQKQFTYNGITQGNRNSLLWRDDSVDGMKTGYTEKAGYCLVSSAEREGMRLIAVVLGTKSPAARANESQALLNYGFRFFETQLLWEQGEILASERVWKGELNEVDLIVNDAVYVTVPRGIGAELTTDFVLPDQLIAPLSASTPVGKATVSIGSDIILTTDIFSATDVPEASLVGGLWDEMLMWFE